MTHASFPISRRPTAVREPIVIGAAISRPALLAVVVVSCAAGLLAADTEAARIAGPDLAHLLRFMAALKAVLAGCALAALYWRLAVPITPARLGAYGLAAAAASSGPGLIWGMGHVGMGALLLHGGLVALVVLLWRDQATAAKLDRILKAKARTRQITFAKPRR